MLTHKKNLYSVKEKLVARLEKCDLCPRGCGVNRLKGERGFCRTGRFAIVSSAFLHFGEEPELVGKGGSGAIFFSNCNLKCIYCQNYTISHLGEGEEVSAEELAKMMLYIQKEGAENINFVTPTHVVAQIVEALCIAIENGLNIPLVYNSGGYDSRDVLELLDGVFDIYMPDIKYSSNDVAEEFSAAPRYWDVVRSAVKEMYRQVGDLVVEGGVAKRGLLIRHLVLPNRLAGSFGVLDFIKEAVSPSTYVNIMDQYHPCYEAYRIEKLARKITDREYGEVLEYAGKIGLIGR